MPSQLGLSSRREAWAAGCWASHCQNHAPEKLQEQERFPYFSECQILLDFLLEKPHEPKLHFSLLLDRLGGKGRNKSFAANCFLLCIEVKLKVVRSEESSFGNSLHKAVRCQAWKEKHTFSRIDDAHDWLVNARSCHHDAEKVDLAATHPHHESHHAQILHLPCSSTVQGLHTCAY